MFYLVLCDDKNKTEKHITLTEEKEKITVSGYVREKGKKKPLPSNVMNEFIELIRLKDFSKYIGEVEEYKLYEDEYKYIHFFKNDKEDYTKFLLFNGKNAILNNEEEHKTVTQSDSLPEKGDILKRVLHFLKKGLSATVALVIVIGGVRLYFSNTAVVEAFKTEMSATYVECNSLEDVIARINAQDNLSDGEKEILTNREILATAIKYSDGKILEKLGWGIYGVNYNEKNSMIANYANGYYMDWLPHVISIKDDLGDSQANKTTIHEYAHLLQNPRCPLFLRELDAVEKSEICSGMRSYRNGYINYGLLKAIVGDDAIKECVHRLDNDFDTKLKMELRKYITEDQYKELMKKLDSGRFYFEKNSISSLEYNKELYAILLEIATLKYGEDNVERLNQLVIHSLRNDYSITKAGVDLRDVGYWGLCTEETYSKDCTIYVKKTTLKEYEYAISSHGNLFSKDGVRIDYTLEHEGEYYICYFVQEGETPPNGYELYWGNPYTKREFVSRNFLLQPKVIEEACPEISCPCAIYALEDLFEFVLTAQSPSKMLTGP